MDMKIHPLHVFFFYYYYFPGRNKLFKHQTFAVSVGAVHKRYICVWKLFTARSEDKRATVSGKMEIAKSLNDIFLWCAVVASNKNPIHLHCIRAAADISDWHLSKPSQTKQTNPLHGQIMPMWVKFYFEWKECVLISKTWKIWSVILLKQMTQSFLCFSNVPPRPKSLYSRIYETMFFFDV